MLFLGTLLLYVYEQQVHKKLKQLRKLKQQLLFVLSGTGTVGCDVGSNNILDFSLNIFVCLSAILAGFDHRILLLNTSKSLNILGNKFIKYF